MLRITSDPNQCKEESLEIRGVTSDPPAKRYSPLKQENQDLFSNGPQYKATDQGGVKFVKPQRRIRASSRYNDLHGTNIIDDVCYLSGKKKIESDRKFDAYVLKTLPYALVVRNQFVENQFVESNL